MNDIVKLISEYGIMIVLSGFLLWRIVAAEKRHAEETKAFTEISAAFANIMANHIHDEQIALGELTKAVERLCIYFEAPNRDYKR